MEIRIFKNCIISENISWAWSKTQEISSKFFNNELWISEKTLQFAREKKVILGFGCVLTVALATWYMISRKNVKAEKVQQVTASSGKSDDKNNEVLGSVEKNVETNLSASQNLNVENQDEGKQEIAPEEEAVEPDQKIDTMLLTWMERGYENADAARAVVNPDPTQYRIQLGEAVYETSAKVLIFVDENNVFGELFFHRMKIQTQKKYSVEKLNDIHLVKILRGDKNLKAWSDFLKDRQFQLVEKKGKR